MSRFILVPIMFCGILFLFLMACQFNSILFYSIPFSFNSNGIECVQFYDVVAFLNLLKWRVAFWEGILNNRKLLKYKEMNVLWKGQIIKAKRLS